jgi:hypothetical protein
VKDAAALRNGEGPARRLASLLLLLELGSVDARLAVTLGSRLRDWRAGALLPLTAGEYRRHKRDVLIGALALTLAPQSGPGTQARRVSAYMRSRTGEAGRYSTQAERLAAQLAHLGEPVPGERQLRSLLGSIPAMRAAADFLISRA